MLLSRRAFTLATGALSALPTLADAASKTDVANARSDLLSFEGRTAKMPDGALRLGFPGVVLCVRFRGAKLVLKSVASSDIQWVDIIADGGEPKTIRLRRGAQDLTLYDGPFGEHTIEVARRNESWEGVWDIVSAEAPAGIILPAAPSPKRKLLFIGDSVTCGAASDIARTDPNAMDLRADNGQKSFGKVLARRLDAQCHLVSYGGRGLVRDWQGVRDTRNAPQFYELAAPDEPAILWNHADYVPDAIGVMLGTNDFNPGIPDQNEFTNAYVQFVEKIRRDAPRASVLLMDSPILTDGDMPKRTVFGAYIDNVVKRLDSRNVVRAPVKHYPGRPVNAHPIAEEHVAMAAELEPLFKQAMA